MVELTRLLEKLVGVRTEVVTLGLWRKKIGLIEEMGVKKKQVKPNNG